MKKLTILTVSLVLSGCAVDSITNVLNSKYESFDGKYIDQPSIETNNLATEAVNTKPELINLRAAADQDLINNPYVDKYLRQILDKLITQWDFPIEKPIKIAVSTDSSYSAFATDDTIVIAQGIIGDANTEDELAFIIAHELSHILLRHNETNEYFAKQSALVSKAANIAMSTALLRDVKSQKTANGYNISIQTTEQSKNLMMDSYRTGLSINRLSRDMISSSMSRSHEDEADLLGIDLMIKAGYSPKAFTTVFDRIEQSHQFNSMQLKAKKQDFQKFVSIASDAGKHIQSDGWATLGYLAANEAATSLLQTFSERHNSALERKKDISAYLKREYRKERKRRQNSEGLTKRLKQGKGHTIQKNYWYASEAIKAIEFGDLNTAEKLAKKGVSGPTKYHAYPRLAFYSVRKMQQKHGKAIQNLNMIRDWNYASIQTFSLAAQSYREQKQTQKALEILDKATKTIGTSTPFFPEYISVYKTSGDSEKLTAILERCKKLEEENIVAQCYTNAGITPEKGKSSSGGLLDSLSSFTELIEI